MSRLRDCASRIKKYRPLIFALSAVVVFVTTYMLILPALTLDENTAAKQGGVDVPAAEQVMQEDAQTQQEPAAETGRQEAKDETPLGENNKTPLGGNNETPLGEEDGTLSCEGKDQTVSIDFQKGSGLSTDTALKVEEIDSEKDEYDKYSKLALGAVKDAGQDFATIEMAKFYDITLEDEEGVVEPADAVDVYIDYADQPKVSGDGYFYIVHFTKNEKTGKLEAAVLDEKDSGFDVKRNKVRSANFTAESFSVYGIVYTVDFHYEADGQVFDYSMEGGGEIMLSELFAALGVDAESSDVAGLEFSDPDLLDVQKTDGDWRLVSLKPFDTEESLTVTMDNGDAFTIVVTDVQRVEQTADLHVDVNNSYIICYEENGVYHVLKTDGTTQDFTTTANFDKLGNDYRWTFYYVFKEKDQLHNMDKEYFFIRPIGDKTKTISLNSPGTQLLQTGTNNVAVIPVDGGFGMEGYTREHQHDTELYYNGTGFVGDTEHSSTISIYRKDPLPEYSFTVKTDNPDYGKVSGRDESGRNRNNINEFISVSTTTEPGVAKTNKYAISAVPVVKAGTDGNNKYLFDHWELDGERIDAPQNIPAESLVIPSNSSELKAFFRIDPNYKPVDPNEKQGTPFEDMDAWLETFKGRNIPLNEDGCKKTAEVYDYENRIYRVDLTSQSSLLTFDGTIDLGFIMDISNSMLFPSKLDPISGRDNFKVRQLNSGSTAGWNSNIWLVTIDGVQYQFDKRKTYYVISDETGTATVYRIYWNNSDNQHNGKWWHSDASKTTTDQYYLDGNSTFKNGTSDQANQYRYQIYEDGSRFDTQGNRVNRLDDLKTSMSTTINAMKELLQILNIGKAETQGSTVAEPDVQIAWTTYADEIKDYNHTFTSASGFNIGSITYRNHGGTRTDLALDDATKFDWGSSATKYAVLITDGAPQKSGTAMTWDEMEGYITDLKNGADNTMGTADDIKLITVGLSMDNVEVGRRLLYDMADEVSGEKGFYSAKSGDELEDILLHILQQIMKPATVTGLVTDVVNEAFYPVDKATGKPIEPGNYVDLEGNLVADSYPGAKGRLQEDGRTFVWENQDFTWDGWHGTIYVKAKEDLLGGNAVLTNDPEQDAQILAQGYKFTDSQIPMPLKETMPTNPHYDLTSTQSSPRVNVNELSFGMNETDWTVYIGTDVDPKQQLQKLYDEIKVEQVVTKAKDTNGDGLPDTVRYAVGDTDNNYYPISPDSIADSRESEVVEGRERSFFYMKDLIAKLAEQTPAGSLDWWNYTTHEIKFDEFIAAASTADGITLEYNEYGLDSDHPDTSNINIKLKSEVVSGEQGLTNSPHPAEVTGDAVEKYTLTVLYTPDYKVTPVGQGGQSTVDFQVGTYGSIYQGHAAGTENSTNVHRINVYAQPLDVVKTDEEGEPLSGAVFELYRDAKDGETGVSLAADDKDLKGSYVLVDTAVSGSDGIAKIAPVSDGDSADNLLLPGETYYLIERTAPQGYERDRSVKIVTVETEEGKYTDLAGTVIKEQVYPFNWDQGARILVDGQPVSVTVKTDEEGTTREQTDGAFISSEAAVSFHTEILNKVAEIALKVEKTWENTSEPPESITFDLYRTAHIDHDWDNGVVTKQGSCNEEGAITYTCHNCGQTRVVAISAEGHKAAEPVREDILAPTCEEDGAYDMVTYCLVCGQELSREHQTEPATGHDWGDWEVMTPATYDAPGVETRVCKNDPEHVETRSIPQMVRKTHITYRINTFWYHENSWAYSDLYIRQQTLVSEEEYEVGSTVNISWTDTNRYQARYYKDVNPNMQTWYFDYYWFAGMTPTQVARTGNGPYTFTADNITVTDGMVIDLCLGYDGNASPDGYYAPDNFTIAQPSRNSASLRSLMAKSFRAILKSADADPDVMTSEQIEAKLAGYTAKAENMDCDTTYYEIEGSYTVTPDGQGQWKWSKDGLPKFDENGNEYTYYVVETSPDSGYETTYLNMTGGMKDGETTTINNKLILGGLEITKNVLFNGGTASTAEEKAKVNGSYKFAVKKDGTEIAGSPFTINVSNGESNSIVIKNLDPGADYTIEETDSGNLVLKGASGGDSVSNNVVTATVTGGKMTAAELLDNGRAQFANNYTEYEVTLLKVDTGDPTALLGGAKFDLYPASAVKDGKVIDGAIPVKTDIISSSDEATKGQLALGTLAAGTYYLVETSAPAGYNLLEAPVQITVGDGTIGITQGSRQQSAEPGAPELMVMNTAGVQLPHTGGMGTTILYILGALLVIGCGIGLVVRRRLASN